MQESRFTKEFQERIDTEIARLNKKIANTKNKYLKKAYIIQIHVIENKPESYFSPKKTKVGDIYLDFFKPLDK